MVWQFAPVRPIDQQEDPFQREFFANASDVENLIREVIQNSLDAGAGDSSVRLKIQFSRDVYALSPERAAPYVEGLAAHLAAVDPNAAKFLTGPMQYLTIEDYGTTGLRGDIAAWKNDDASNDFFWFWRNVARSGKRGDAGGSWGVGKWVVPASSHIGAFFGLTARLDDPQLVLMGQTVLKIHDVNGIRYQPYGYFCPPVADGDPYVPFQEPEVLQRFARDFRLLRSGTAMGLSLVIPYPNVSIEPSEIKLAVLRNYFWALLTGHLQVDIIDGNSRERLDQSTTLAFAQAHRNQAGGDDYEVARLVDLAQWLIEEGMESATLTIPPVEGAPDWAKVTLVEEQKAAARARLESGSPISVHVETDVARTDGTTQRARFTIALQQEDPAPTALLCEFVRRDMSIPGAGTLKSGDIRTLVVISPGWLADLLRDAEEPSHRSWKQRQVKVKQNWQHGDRHIQFVNRSAEWLATELTRTPVERSEDLLQDIFFLEETTGETRPAATVPPPTPPTPKPRPFTVARTASGFRISLRADGATRVTFAYDRREGNPFARYDEADCSLATLQVLPTSCTLEPTDSHSFMVRTSDKPGEVEVSGFDERRDIIVRAEAVAE